MTLTMAIQDQILDLDERELRAVLLCLTRTHEDAVTEEIAAVLELTRKDGAPV